MPAPTHPSSPQPSPHIAVAPATATDPLPTHPKSPTIPPTHPHEETRAQPTLPTHPPPPRNPPPTCPSRQRPAPTTIETQSHAEATGATPKAINQPFLYLPASGDAKKSFDYHTGDNNQTSPAASLRRGASARILLKVPPPLAATGLLYGALQCSEPQPRDTGRSLERYGHLCTTRPRRLRIGGRGLCPRQLQPLFPAQLTG